MRGIFHYRDIVTYNDNTGEFCILCQSPQSGYLANEKDYIALDLWDTSRLVYLDENEIIKIDELEDANPCPPVFDSAIPLMSKVIHGAESQIGTVIAVNPILLPINFECEYLINLENGKSTVLKSSEFTVIETYDW